MKETSQKEYIEMLIKDLEKKIDFSFSLEGIEKEKVLEENKNFKNYILDKIFESSSFKNREAFDIVFNTAQLISKETSWSEFYKHFLILDKMLIKIKESAG